MADGWYSIQRGELIYAQISTTEAKKILDHVKGHWMPYKAKLSGKLVTAYILDESAAFTQKDRTWRIALDPHDALYPDDDMVPK